MNKIISIDLHADFGFLKKPDTNDPVYFTYNMLHKPALLGILGAILGLGGFSEAKKYVKPSGKNKDIKPVNKRDFLPEYYQVLEGLKIGIKPLSDEKGNFQKTIIKYNNGVGYANLDGGNMIITEQTLIKPSFCCYILLEEKNAVHQKLYESLKQNKAEFLPYLGKNDFSIWWNGFEEFDFNEFNSTDSGFKCKSIFAKNIAAKEGLEELDYMQILMGEQGNTFVYFENLPFNYDLNLMQYNFKPFVFTDWNIKQNYPINSLYQLSNDEIIQLF